MTRDINQYMSKNSGFTKDTSVYDQRTKIKPETTTQSISLQKGLLRTNFSFPYWANVLRIWMLEKSLHHPAREYKNVPLGTTLPRPCEFDSFTGDGPFQNKSA